MKDNIIDYIENQERNNFKQTEIGLIPEDWEVVIMKKITNTITDYVANGSFASLKANVKYKNEEDYAILLRTKDHSNYFRGPFVYVDEHAYNFLSKTKLKPCDIILSNVGTVGTVFRVPKLKKPMSLGPNAILIRANDSDDFMYYWLKSDKGQKAVWGITTKTAQPKFNKTDFRNLKIPIPPPNIQQKIVKRLDTIRKAQELNEKQISLANELFQSLLHQEFNSVIKKSEIKEIGKVVEKVTDGTHNVPQLTESGIPLLDSTFINNFEIDIKKATKFISVKTDKELSYRCKPQKGDILISSRGSIGKLALVNEDQNFNVMCNIALIRPGVNFLSKYVLYFLCSFYAKHQLGIRSYGTSQKALYIKDIKKIKIPVLSIKIQYKIIKKLSIIQEYKKKLLRQKELLQELFESTLNKAMKGELVK